MEDLPRYVPEKPMYGLRTSEGGEPIRGSDLRYIEDSSKRDDAAEVLNVYLDQQREQRTEPHIYLNMLFTDSAFQDRGLGNTMMEWGNELADSLMVASWVEASEHGQKLYLKAGYEAGQSVLVKNKSWTVEWLPMRRPAKQLKHVDIK
ncbi:uncharacterized protein AB675_8047 [Cyphellophora attinorum]|uniref:N-acetyltransferase domain-containing protein n=1 Tax=Cyphellophora attinorum TaxID=1664694 RepID=A0A0N1HAZ8_9EURO|nr:uncharacterized protein AB675_8047 [Phialophora attinorum]KPI41334.1 hypothetical protein AB675_8047 [Phialophora attinorum]